MEFVLQVIITLMITCKTYDYVYTGIWKVKTEIFYSAILHYGKITLCSF